MSSAAIAIQITEYEASIALKEADAVKLREKIAEQEQLKANFAGQRNLFNEEYAQKEMQCKAISTYAAISVFAKRFSEYTEGLVSSGKNSDLQQQLDTIETKMQSEINSNEQALAELEAQIAAESNIVAQLQVDYQNALAAEEEERRRAEEAAAAAAAALANSTGRKGK